MLNLKVKKINELAILPQYAHEGDAGLDLFSVEEKIIMPGETVLVHTGIQIELPKDTEAQIRPRSGLALKNSITVLNTPGTIDEGYRGEIGIILINHSKIDFRVEKNMKIAQMVIKPVLKVSIVEVDELNSTQRGKGGFGSTGLANNTDNKMR
ncbi:MULTISPECIES: dUTP diphosphatase [Clostridium]|uniref:Deoxyuridine 5'-triphosphate nucleotidohydrolase n=1 Tax=Clostridium frigoriphilum TaxID=443253 RepID=A0ABU7UJH9_9CLOT|nr:dUTP diphosphatase [Clostridium sp. DSM 17811]MBU3098502.1 dUTP diphosphatase [Clostridium sp. DSM 17811]